MWLSIISGIKILGSLWLKQKEAEANAKIAFRNRLAESEASWDLVAQQQAQYSWKDELITVIWFSPLIIVWFEPERADQWVKWVSELPYFYQFGIFGIMSASFGLRWYFKQQSFKLNSNPKGQVEGAKN